MHRAGSNEVDCAECPSARRCWRDEVNSGAGFLVRRLRHVEAGETLFRQGAGFDAPLIVTSGCIAIIDLLPDGEERIVAFRVPGEIIGLESWDRRVHRFGARALTGSTLCRLRWTAGVVRNASLLRALLTKATAPAGAAPWAGLSAVERVRAFVEDFRSRTDQPMPMTRAQIGQHLGMAEETVVRAFKQLGRH